MSQTTFIWMMYFFCAIIHTDRQADNDNSNCQLCHKRTPRVVWKTRNKTSLCPRGVFGLLHIGRQCQDQVWPLAWSNTSCVFPYSEYTFRNFLYDFQTLSVLVTVISWASSFDAMNVLNLWLLFRCSKLKILMTWLSKRKYMENWSAVGGEDMFCFHKSYSCIMVNVYTLYNFNSALKLHLLQTFTTD